MKEYTRVYKTAMITIMYKEQIIVTSLLLAIPKLLLVII